MWAHTLSYNTEQMDFTGQLFMFVLVWLIVFIPLCQFLHSVCRWELIWASNWHYVCQYMQVFALELQESQNTSQWQRTDIHKEHKNKNNVPSLTLQHKSLTKSTSINPRHIRLYSLITGWAKPNTASKAEQPSHLFSLRSNKSKSKLAISDQLELESHIAVISNTRNVQFIDVIKITVYHSTLIKSQPVSVWTET